MSAVTAPAPRRRPCVPGRGPARPRLRGAVALVAAVASGAALAGCGNDDAGRAEATPAPTGPAAVPDPRGQVAGPRLSLRAGKGDDAWKVSAAVQGEQVCTSTRVPGSSPAPTCADATTTAAGLVTANGGVRPEIHLITDQNARPREALVWGTVLRDVRKVDVRAADRRVTADLSRRSITVSIDRKLLDAVRSVAKDAPPEVQLRIFAATVPISEGDRPPTRATVTPARPGASPSVTVRLN